MAWNRSRAETRITEYRKSVPKSEIVVETFDDRFSREVHMYESRGLGRPSARSVLTKIPPSQAVLVHGVHVYVQLIDYHKVLKDVQRVSEARHRRALQFLHMHYSASDRVISEYEAQRVDYHGPRLHAVIAMPSGPAREKERIQIAIDFANSIKLMIETTGQKVLGGEFETRVRIGIDSGTAVAVNSGRGDEQEPLFLGNPANYAAKLADGDEPGIFLSDHVRRVIGLNELGGIYNEKRTVFTEDPFAASFLYKALSANAITAMADEVRSEIEPNIRDANFQFHRHQPPLSTIKYSELSPSNSIHMQMLSIFADIDGFTAYVERSIAQGEVAQLVANLHVIRKELAAVLKYDFDGRKVRFIGDCLHGLLAVGTRTETDSGKTIEAGVICAGAMRSSFELCQEMLPGIRELGLAIGLEYGSTPVTRLGNRGELSVRCATSTAVSVSEEVQTKLNGKETGLGEKAYTNAPVRVRDVFAKNMIASNLTYAVAATLLSTATTVSASTGSLASDFRPHSEG